MSPSAFQNAGHAQVVDPDGAAAGQRRAQRAAGTSPADRHPPTPRIRNRRCRRSGGRSGSWPRRPPCRGRSAALPFTAAWPRCAPCAPCRRSSGPPPRAVAALCRRVDDGKQSVTLWSVFDSSTPRTGEGWRLQRRARSNRIHAGRGQLPDRSKGDRVGPRRWKCPAGSACVNVGDGRAAAAAVLRLSGHVRRSAPGVSAHARTRAGPATCALAPRGRHARGGVHPVPAGPCR